MTDSKIASEYLRVSSTLTSVTEELNLTRADVGRAIMSFMCSHKESSYTPKIRRKFGIELTKSFLVSNKTAKDFAEENGLLETPFIILVGEIIDDPSIMSSDYLADKIYRKLLTNRKSLGKYTPNRILKIISKQYVSSKWITQQAIAYSYNISRNSVATLLRLAIERGILKKDLADMVISKSCHQQSEFLAQYRYKT